MNLDQDTVARDLLAAARSLADRPASSMASLWPRAAVLLARQSLEVALRTYWSAKARGVEEAPMTAQLLCLGPWLGNDALARRGYLTWSSLSRAAHYHPYELMPSSAEIQAWCDTVQEVVEATERAWRGREA